MKDIDFTNIPKHIGIIMDGNGRWAKNRFLPRIAGHKEGMNRVVDIVEECCKIGVKTLTLYAFSTENWKRPEEEVNGLMNILVFYINSQLKRILDNNIIFRVIGDYSKLPSSIVKLLDNSINVSKNNTGMVLNIALNYGGRAEIISSIKNLYNDISQGKFSIDDLNEESFKKYLYTKENSEVDLIIRTGNEKRISNFLIYQLAYSEFYFTDVLWPEFYADDLYDAIYDFQNRNRRFGGI
ncbi:isoprenyl transferase [Parvimonas sp. oral taxon 393]|uniref:isoprenyl transferase n=1 Tax=Parvimonas sp. G1967 TaxID=3387695 RepID=UPI00021D3910|nr:di-trans,poly-cis-decaprenylcistransferase [Parvimonas sp. oral taxon 393 str. F0440]